MASSHSARGMRSLLGLLARKPLVGHADALVLPTVLADTARHVGGVGAVLEVISACCRQRGFERGRPLFVGLNLGRRQVAGHRG